MCRWLAYQGEAIYMDELVYKPAHSLVNQSIDARKAVTRVNADGFGLGWYSDRDTPGQFHEVLPAWGDENLASLAHHIRTHRFMAHVRSSTGGSVARSNCHPFIIDNWMFLHNGQIAQFDSVKYGLEHTLPESLYLKRKGTTDSELMFLMMLKYGLKEDPIRAIKQTFAEIVAEMARKGITEAFKASICLSDGKQFWVVRYSTDNNPPTVFMSQGCGRMIFASEPLDTCKSWESLPVQSLIHATDNRISTHSLADFNLTC